MLRIRFKYKGLRGKCSIIGLIFSLQCLGQISFNKADVYFPYANFFDVPNHPYNPLESGFTVNPKCFGASFYINFKDHCFGVVYERYQFNYLGLYNSTGQSIPLNTIELRDLRNIGIEYVAQTFDSSRNELFILPKFGIDIRKGSEVYSARINSPPDVGFGYAIRDFGVHASLEAGVTLLKYIYLSVEPRITYYLLFTKEISYSFTRPGVVNPREGPSNSLLALNFKLGFKLPHSLPQHNAQKLGDLD